MPMDRKVLTPLAEEELDEIYDLWKRDRPASGKYVGRLIREIRHLKKRDQELRDIYFLTNGVHVERVSKEEARLMFEEADRRIGRRGLITTTKDTTNGNPRVPAGRTG